jgi:hypothetical protein
MKTKINRSFRAKIGESILIPGLPTGHTELTGGNYEITIDSDSGFITVTHRRTHGQDAQVNHVTNPPPVVRQFDATGWAWEPAVEEATDKPVKGNKQAVASA